MGRVLANYLLTALFVVLDFGIAWLLAWVAVHNIPALASNRARLWAFLLGSAMLLVAGIGRLGWSIQTLGGETRPERFDRWIFFALSLSGTFLLVYDFFVGKLAR